MLAERALIAVYIGTFVYGQKTGVDGGLGMRVSLPLGIGRVAQAAALGTLSTLK